MPLHLAYLVQFCSPYQKGDKLDRVTEKKNKDDCRYGTAFVQGKIESLKTLEWRKEDLLEVKTVIYKIRSSTGILGRYQ